ncbi:hypothetical protein M436DRAFT_86023 [Aureobasidium namibiae CBS 147.97]|uniref:Cryptic loci regulator 2 N-terminal domain-containing protein n=1 Tax=Aureobasidium namibiae CBS 147.97 TaxID=1043004 RepID=A0A074W7K8_9PEZI
MAFHPTIGGLRLPAPAAAGPMQIIDLDLLPSDGDRSFCHEGDPLFAVVDPDQVAQDFRAAFGRQADLQVLFGGAPFQTRGLPLGYQVEHRVYPGRREMRIYGHPSGHYFKSWRTWGVHLTSLLKEDLQNCACCLCASWRTNAPAHAAIVVGLPLVAGGAVPAALAATVAREQQRVREEAATGQSVDLLVRASEVVDLPEWQRVIIQEAVQSILGRGR